ncbi:hypothetical protein F4777DRAFT_539861 [Nemania sp. FL0916]|nr:hypothetical protein F4777DRAFT_539861 [Nemania sp. FL0916]
MERKAFKVLDSGFGKVYEARVDGYLRRRADGEPLAIVEVKPFNRKAKHTEIRMQESAQMAARVCQHPCGGI